MGKTLVLASAVAFLQSCLFFDSVAGPRAQPQDDACVDGEKSEGEGDVDCGGACEVKCDDGQTCGKPEDCASNACENGRCGLSTTGNNFGFQPTFPVHKARHYGSHDVARRTLTFTHTGTSAECSHDGGGNFTACDTLGSIVFTLQDVAENRDLVIKVGNGVEKYSYHYRPAMQHPGVSFYACDETVMANEGYSAFQARLTQDKTVCLAASVRITPDSRASLQPTASGTRILGLESAPAVFDATNGDYVFFWTVTGVSRTPNQVLAHAAFLTHGSVAWNGQHAGKSILSDVTMTIDGYGYGVLSDGNSNDLTIEDSTIEGVGSGCGDSSLNAVRFTAFNGTATPTLTIRRSTLRTRFAPALSVTAGTLIAEDSVIERTSTSSCVTDALDAVEIEGGDLTFRKTTVSGGRRPIVMARYAGECSGSAGNVCSSVAWALTLDNATVRGGESLVYLATPAAPPAPRLTLLQSTFRRTSPVIGAGSAISVNPASVMNVNCGGSACTGTPQVDEAMAGSTFCAEAMSPAFTVQSGSTMGTFAAGGYSVGACP